MGLPLTSQVAITIPDGFTVWSADADADGIYLLALSDSQARILTYLADGGLPHHSLEIGYDETYRGLTKYGDGWVVSGRRRLVPFSRLGIEGESGGNDFQFTQMWSIDWDEREDRFVAWGIQGIGTFGCYNLQARTFDKDYAPNNLDAAIVSEDHRLSRVYETQGFATQHDSRWVFVYPDGSGQAVLITDENFVPISGETQALPTEHLQGIASRNAQLVMVTEGMLHFYGVEVLPVLGESVEQIPFDTDYLQQYSIVRPTNPIRVVAADVPMVMNIERGYEMRGPDGTINKIDRVIRLIPKDTVPGVEEGDRIFPHRGASGVAPTSIPDGAWTVDDQDIVGNVLQQQIYCKD